NITGSSAQITWTTNEAATSRVEYGLTTAYGSSTTLDTTLVTAHSVALTNLAPNTTYNYRVRSIDAAGNERVSANSTFKTAAVPDTSAPTVAISAPTGAVPVSGTVTVSANASDNVAVAGVQFLLDDVALGIEDTTAPYSISWNTTTASNSVHTLAARARDTSGNSATSSLISVTVDNQAPSGSVVINGGAAATKNTTVALALSAADTQGPVTQMRFSNDGTTFSAAEAYATSKSWALTSGDGTKTVYVQYQDAAGNWSTAATDSIVLDTTAPSTSGITATVVTSSSVIITWTTNEPSTSQVEYGLTTAYGSSTTLDTTPVTAHSVALIGLTSNATYNFRVHSSDALANEAVSANATFIIDTATPSIPTGLTATAISQRRSTCRGQHRPTTWR
ncbi:MAG: Ig-like domain-containing protein, partial [Rhodoplanes sp.]